jgi:signal transduction histidine kinase
MPTPELQRINVNDAVRNALKLVQPQLTAPAKPPINAALELEESLDREPMLADPELLHRALSNLILNALDAMPQGGTLTLRTRNQQSQIQIYVSDTGVGLTPEERERIFTPYYTSKQHGTGLGLAIVQSIVSDHGGRISVESRPQRGSTFIIELPKR